MKKATIIIIFILLVTVFAETFYIIHSFYFKNNTAEDVAKKEIPKPLLAYTFENLKRIDFPATQITFGEVVEDADQYTQRMFYFSTPKTPEGKEMDKVSGLATIPKKEGEFPVVIMFRGFIPEDSFVSGSGTSPSARELSKNGYMTLAPDFLGFGESASPSANNFEERFQTYTTALTLLESLETLNTSLDEVYVGTISANLDRVGLWGHSNGGHIALATLAVSGKSYPTVLWSPVSKSFPYSILYYTDETDDQGKGLRSALYKFEELYDTKDFSPERYYKWIKAPIQINQDTNDKEVPYWWSDELVGTLKENDIDVEYNKFPDGGHNLVPFWSDAVTNTIEFYNSTLKQP